MSTTKYLIGGAILAGGGFFLYRLLRLSKHLQSVATASIRDISFSKLTIQVNVKLKNPTNGTLTLNYPFVRLDYKGETIGSSQAIKKAVTIPAHGEATIRGILIQIPLLSLASLSGDFLKLLKGSNEGIALEVVTLSEIQSSIGASIPFKKTESITLKNAPAK